MINDLLIAVIVFAGVFTQTVAGFGLALIAMPLLVSTVGLTIAGPLIAIVAMTTRVSMLFRYRNSFDVQEIWQLTLGSLLGIVIATVFLTNAGNSHLFEVGLGVFIIGYAVANLIDPTFPHLKRRFWAYPFGIASGVLARIYNIGGPPAVIYGNGRRWQPTTFKGNLQAYAMLNGLLVIATRVLHGEFTDQVLRNYVISLPATGFALLLGFLLDRYINPVIFRRIILTLLIVIGVSLVL